MLQTIAQGREAPTDAKGDKAPTDAKGDMAPTAANPACAGMSKGKAGNERIGEGHESSRNDSDTIKNIDFRSRLEGGSVSDLTGF